MTVWLTPEATFLPFLKGDGGEVNAVNTETAMSSTGDTGNSESMLENRS